MQSLDANCVSPPEPLREVKKEPAGDDNNGSYLTLRRVPCRICRQLRVRASLHHLLRQSARQTGGMRRVQAIPRLQSLRQALVSHHEHQVCAAANLCSVSAIRSDFFSELNRRSPLSRGQAHVNHRSCPLCRTEWLEKPQVVPYCMLTHKAVDCRAEADDGIAEIESDAEADPAPPTESTSACPEPPNIDLSSEPTSITAMLQLSQESAAAARSASTPVPH